MFSISLTYKLPVSFHFSNPQNYFLCVDIAAFLLFLHFIGQIKIFRFLWAVRTNRSAEKEALWAEHGRLSAATVNISP